MRHILLVPGQGAPERVAQGTPGQQKRAEGQMLQQNSGSDGNTRILMPLREVGVVARHKSLEAMGGGNAQGFVRSPLVAFAGGMDVIGATLHAPTLH